MPWADLALIRPALVSALAGVTAAQASGCGRDLGPTRSGGFDRVDALDGVGLEPFALHDLEPGRLDRGQLAAGEVLHDPLRAFQPEAAGLGPGMSRLDETRAGRGG